MKCSLVQFHKSCEREIIILREKKFQKIKTARSIRHALYADIVVWVVAKSLLMTH